MQRILFFFLLISTQAYAQSDALETAFLDPPVEARPRALWDWVNGNFSLPAITYELEEAKRKGMGGFDIWDVGIMVDPNNVVPAGPPFMGPESVQAIGHTVREAERVGLDIGLTIASSWGTASEWVDGAGAGGGGGRPARFLKRYPFAVTKAIG